MIFKIIQGKITLHCDSQSAIHLVKNPTLHGHLKHVDIKYRFIRKVVEEGRILLEKIDTNENPTDMLIKSIKTEKFGWCKTSLGLLKM